MSADNAAATLASRLQNIGLNAVVTRTSYEDSDGKDSKDIQDIQETLKHVTAGSSSNTPSKVEDMLVEWANIEESNEFVQDELFKEYRVQECEVIKVDAHEILCVKRHNDRPTADDNLKVEKRKHISTLECHKFDDKLEDMLNMCREYDGFPASVIKSLESAKLLVRTAVKRAKLENPPKVGQTGIRQFFVQKHK